ncbi:high-affinity nickel-transport protein [Pseudoduganella flava]|uniref:Nickel/cobalt efflux system n=1 Tax=Pseudoduganella flava TaxID=871742 RepID=A0A562Q186_9BURK|nr:hypothetical protein [Pseudoduganella flava]QGZ38084.1 hypothetical protein GO485_02825 [Pseudoduganella flava]TWI50403.1 high-affinity nickel-transport protein [Pseudoduganella flava]
MQHTVDAVLPGLTLALVMGLRHGLAPDHLAVVDALTARAAAQRPRHAPWMGAMFACGHALVVLAIVAAASLTSSWVAPYQALVRWIDYAPPVFLLVLAALNARQLLRPVEQGAGRPALERWLPRMATLRAAAMTGALFAIGFESALQAIAWGYAAGAAGSPGAALLVAAVFTAGMAITDGIDGMIASRMLATGSPERMRRFRRRLGLPIVALCVASAAVMLVELWCPACGLDEGTHQAFGGAIVAATLVAYGCALRAAVRERRTVAG